MGFFKKLLDDVRRGENIDLYAAVLLAVTLALLTLLHIDVERFTAPLSLAIMALIAYSLLNIREFMRHVSFGHPVEQVLRQDWADGDIRERLQKCNDLLLIGPILLRATKNFYAIYEERLKRGARMRVLLVNPDHVAADIIGTRPYSDVNVERTRSEIRASLQSWQHLSQGTGGRLELRVIDYPLSYGGFFFDTGEPNGSIYVRYYPYKMRDDTRPRLVLYPRDAYWFAFYCEEAAALWAAAVPWGTDKVRQI